MPCWMHTLSLMIRHIQWAVNFDFESSPVNVTRCGRDHSGAAALPGNDVLWLTVNSGGPPLWPLRLSAWTLIYSLLCFLDGLSGQRHLSQLQCEMEWFQKNVILCGRHAATWPHTHAQVGTCSPRTGATGWHGTIRYSLLCVKWTGWTYAPPLQVHSVFGPLKAKRVVPSVCFRQKGFRVSLWNHTVIHPPSLSSR